MSNSKEKNDFSGKQTKKRGARGEFNLFSSTKRFYQFTWKSPKQIKFSWRKMPISHCTYGNFRANWIAPREQGFWMKRPIFYNFQALLESISSNLCLRSKVSDPISFSRHENGVRIGSFWKSWWIDRSGHSYHVCFLRIIHWSR